MRAFLPAVLAAIVLGGGAAAQAVTLDFESLSHGQIVEEDLQASHGIDVSANNVNGGPDIAVAFDTTRTGTADPDLEDPWNGGNIPSSEVLGMALILQTRGQRPQGDFVSNPNDEGRRPAGSIFIDFLNAPIDSLGFDLIDVEGGSEFSQNAGYVGFYDGATLLYKVGFGEFANGASPFFRNATYGNNYANRIAPLLTAPANRVEFNFGGSGAIDNLVWTNPPSQQPPTGAVPEPVTATMTLLAGGALVIAGRRRR